MVPAALPYGDASPYGAQPTLAYDRAVRLDDRTTADAALAACRVELDRVGNCWHPADTDPVMPTLLVVPEQLFEVADLEDCPTVAAAIASLRASLVVHADLPFRSVAAEVEGRYWSRSGLTAEQRTWILGALASVFGDVDTDDRPAGAVLAEALDVYIGDGASDAIAVLKRWVAGRGPDRRRVVGMKTTAPTVVAGRTAPRLPRGPWRRPRRSRPGFSVPEVAEAARRPPGPSPRRRDRPVLRTVRPVLERRALRSLLFYLLRKTNAAFPLTRRRDRTESGAPSDVRYSEKRRFKDSRP